MCGIIAVLRRRCRRRAPKPAEIRQALAAAREAVPQTIGDGELAGTLRAGAAEVARIDEWLRGTAGLECLLAHPDLAAELERELGVLVARTEEVERALDLGTLDPPPGAGGLEELNGALVALKDALWAVLRDRLRNAREVAALAGGRMAGRAAVEGFGSIQTALSALDRLEVRGRDSAGLHVFVVGQGLDLASPPIVAELERRADPLFGSGAARRAGPVLSFVYKAAAEIGELGDNVAALRRAIGADVLLARALAHEDAELIVLGHTRWASVGIISESNAHPLNQEELGREGGPYVVGALNGDVDNYLELALAAELSIATEITTDAKIIPALVSRRMADGEALEDAFRNTVASFVGSVAVGVACAEEPDRLALALRGSGQALYVGLCEDAFLVASEPYGLVEETVTYLRMDGETPGNPEQKSASRGQIVVLDRKQAGELAGIRRVAYDGTPLPVEAKHLTRAEITTRDIDRGAFPHFLLKEITEAPRSMQKTLRGKIRERSGRLESKLDASVLSDLVRARLRSGAIRRVLVIGQGTAAVAGQGVAAFLAELVAESPLAVTALPATELSGFGLRDDMSDALVIAISQSGTTTDTNRTVDLVRGRGATVTAIVNRRNSDLCHKADGVLYTSDGRDVEMSVASTKAFYAQIAAGCLLACDIARELGVGAESVSELLRGLRELPDAMQRALAARPAIAAAAREHATRRRYWAIVGNGHNRIAAAEVRIKLSELCYKAIACDATEDKKHIDLSSEPLILICAAGLGASNADDVAKEVAIYRAHKAAPIVVATEGETRFAAALAVIEVPHVHPSLAFVLSAVAGHLFGYEAALAIDALAQPLREVRGAIERATSSDKPTPRSEVRQPADGDSSRAPADLLRLLSPKLTPHAGQFFTTLAGGAYDGQLEASTAARLASLLRFALGTTPLESFAVEHGKTGTPSVVIEELVTASTRAIDELTRPVDAIKHQAKTVTVGISRSDDALLTAPLVRALLAAGTDRDHVSYRDLRSLAALDAAVADVVGWTRYTIEGSPEDDAAKIAVAARGGVSKDFPSRTDTNHELRGTKHQVAVERQCLVAVGRKDGRTVLLVPLVEGNRTVGIALLHVRLHERISATAARGALRGYRDRYSVLRDVVLETEETFREERLGEIPVVELLTTPIHVLADRWRATSDSRTRAV